MHGAHPAPPSAHGPAHNLPARLLEHVNHAALVLGMLALLASAIVLCGAVFLRYFLREPTDWQDEAAVFLLVGTTFLCAGHVQQVRGHIGIEAITGLLPAGVDRVRRALVDLASLLFCAFFTWKCAALFHEAWSEGQTTASAWAPPLAIPYGLMTAGMTLLTVNLLAQLGVTLRRVIAGTGNAP